MLLSKTSPKKKRMCNFRSLPCQQPVPRPSKPPRKQSNAKANAPDSRAPLELTNVVYQV